MSRPQTEEPTQLFSAAGQAESQRILPEVLDAEWGSGAHGVPQHQVLQSGVLLVFRQTLAAQDLSPLHSQLFYLF